MEEQIYMIKWNNFYKEEFYSSNPEILKRATISGSVRRKWDKTFRENLGMKANSEAFNFKFIESGKHWILFEENTHSIE